MKWHKLREDPPTEKAEWHWVYDPSFTTKEAKFNKRFWTYIDGYGWSFGRTTITHWAPLVSPEEGEVSKMKWHKLSDKPPPKADLPYLVFDPTREDSYDRVYVDYLYDRDDGRGHRFDSSEVTHWAEYEEPKE